MSVDKPTRGAEKGGKNISAILLLHHAFTKQWEVPLLSRHYDLQNYIADMPVRHPEVSVSRQGRQRARQPQQQFTLEVEHLPPAKKGH